MAGGVEEENSRNGIASVACKLNDLIISMPPPSRRLDILWAMNGMGLNCHKAEQGFIDFKGEFLTRREAYVIAFKNSTKNIDRELFSEDL